MADEEYEPLKLTPIREYEDGTNNYDGFKLKARLDLDAAGYWRYVDGPDYIPPPPDHISPDADKKALALIVSAVPASKLYIVRTCTSAHSAWRALKHHYEPTDPFMGVYIQQTMLSYQCEDDMDPIKWREVMVQLYHKLCDADADLMSDTVFAKYLVMLMPKSSEWRYCRDSLRERMYEAERTPEGKKVSSEDVLERMRAEEVYLRIAPCMVAIDALVAGVGKGRPDQVRADKRRNRRPAPYEKRVICENAYCETPLGHRKAECFSYGGDKAGMYPESFRGKRDLHLAPVVRIAERRKQALDRHKQQQIGN